MRGIPLTIALLTYNRGRSGYLRESLEAILGQTYGDFELLVLDNHSTDETSEIVLSYKDPRLVYIRQAPGGHSSTNYYHAIWMSRGTFVLPTHDDDVMEPTMVERQMAFLARHPDLLSLATNVSLIDEKGTLIHPRLYELGDDLVFLQGQYIPAYLAEQIWLPAPTCLLRRDAHVVELGESVHVKDTDHFPVSDLLNFFLLNMRGPIGILADPLLRYRQHSGQATNHVNLSGLMVQLVEYLLTYAAKNPALRPCIAAVHGAHAKYQARDCLLNQGAAAADASLLQMIGALKKTWEDAVPPEARALDAVLPFEILLCGLGLGSTIPDACLDLLDLTPPAFSATAEYRRWTRIAHSGCTLFSRRPELRRIAVFGSIFTAFLLVQEARRAGIEVVCCLDSSPARIGQRVLGVPVVCHEDLRTLGAVDAVILSNERNHDEVLKTILSAKLPDPSLSVLSWRKLAQEALPPRVTG